jgi:non-canonical purine NTP pyrophosphatase (RdgB/HAM1 family)
VCIVGLDGMARFTEGICEGVITRQPIGENGFGYDPIFYLPEFGKTMAQLSQDEKNSISHRGKAIRAAVGIIETLVS